MGVEPSSHALSARHRGFSLDSTLKGILGVPPEGAIQDRALRPQTRDLGLSEAGASYSFPPLRLCLRLFATLQLQCWKRQQRSDCEDFRHGDTPPHHDELAACCRGPRQHEEKPSAFISALCAMLGQSFSRSAGIAPGWLAISPNTICC